MGPAGVTELSKSTNWSGLIRPNSRLCMTEYDAQFGLSVAFPPRSPRNVLGEVVSAAQLTQLRMAETEKYAHVTFFFNSGLEETAARLAASVIVPFLRLFPSDPV